jgi:hypothetical protein
MGQKGNETLANHSPNRPQDRGVTTPWPRRPPREQIASFAHHPRLPLTNNCLVLAEVFTWAKIDSPYALPAHEVAHELREFRTTRASAANHVLTYTDADPPPRFPRRYSNSTRESPCLLTRLLCFHAYSGLCFNDCRLMALPIAIHDVRPHQRSPRSSRQLPKHHKRTSSNSTLGSDGCRYCKRDSGMLSRHQEPWSPAMSAPNHPSGPKRHVLHRQPRLSPLSRQRELAEKGLGDAVADMHDGTSRQTGTASSASPKLAGDLATSHASSHGWVPIRSGANASRSFEWETETLLNMVSYPCPYRKRNPARFNFRDHEACARAPFKSVFDLVYIHPSSLPASAF